MSKLFVSKQFLLIYHETSSTCEKKTKVGAKVADFVWILCLLGATWQRCMIVAEYIVANLKQQRHKLNRLG